MYIIYVHLCAKETVNTAEGSGQRDGWEGGRATAASDLGKTAVIQRISLNLQTACAVCRNRPTLLRQDVRKRLPALELARAGDHYVVRFLWPHIVTGRPLYFCHVVSFFLLFTARGSYTSEVLGVVILSVRLSVCLSVTRVLCD